MVGPSEPGLLLKSIHRLFGFDFCLAFPRLPPIDFSLRRPVVFRLALPLRPPTHIVIVPLPLLSDPGSVTSYQKITNLPVDRTVTDCPSHDHGWSCLPSGWYRFPAYPDLAGPAPDHPGVAGRPLGHHDRAADPPDRLAHPAGPAVLAPSCSPLILELRKVLFRAAHTLL